MASSLKLYLWAGQLGELADQKMHGHLLILLLQVCWFARAATRKYYKLSGLNNRNLLFHSFGN